MFVVTMDGPTRVTVNPNSASRRDPDLVVAAFDDADGPVHRGMFVVAVQPDDDETCDYVGTAVVSDIDADHGLIYLHVDWSSFTEERSVSEAMWNAGGVHVPTTVKLHGHRVSAPGRDYINQPGLAALSAS